MQLDSLKFIYFVGVIDEETKKLMDADRCGVKDIPDTQRDTKRKKRYALNGKSFKHTQREMKRKKKNRMWCVFQ